jgi:hypothetical protein
LGSAPVSAPRKRPAPYAAASEVYLGRDLAGSIVVETKGVVRAFDADGKRLGTFGTDREAMREILERARAVREGER